MIPRQAIHPQEGPRRADEHYGRDERQASSSRGSDRRPRFRPADRLLWTWLRRLWDGWRDSLVLVHPATVGRWHREGFRRYWARKSRRRSGRPRVDLELIRLVRRMATLNPVWGAPRIHGELLKLGIEISERTVSRWMPRQRKPPSQTWRTFLDNHLRELVSIDFFTVPTARFQVLFCFLVLSHDRLLGQPTATSA